jgi:hypothetical protein
VDPPAAKATAAARRVWSKKSRRFSDMFESPRSGAAGGWFRIQAA